MITTNSIARALRYDDASEIKALYDNSFSHLTLYYGHRLENDFLDRRVFSSSLYDSDCSMVQLCGDRKIKAVLLANLKQYPNQGSSNYVYLNQVIVAQDRFGVECGRRLIANFSKAARLSGKTRATTSLQWGGVWPGILNEDVPTREVLQYTGGQLSSGEVFVQSNISDLIATCRSSCRPLPAGIKIRPYSESDSVGLRLLLSRNFSIGWFHETLGKVGLSIENFNGYGLAKIFCPMDVFVVVKGKTVCGFCVVQSVTRDNTSFFGPIGLEPEIRGGGIGLCLLLKAVEYLRDRGKTTIGLWTSKSIYSRFYARLGMKRTMQTHHFEWNLRAH